MSSLSKEAVLVHEALVARGLETPLRPPVREMDNETRKNLISGHMTEIMQLLNLDLSDDSLMETPRRIAKMYVDEIFSGLDYANFPKITVIENKMKVDEMVTVRDITLTSTCEHHFVTIDGKATVAYIPKESVIGLSKINRIVQFFAQRPQVQERLTQQILTALQTLCTRFSQPESSASAASPLSETADFSFADAVDALSRQPSAQEDTP